MNVMTRAGLASRYDRTMEDLVRILQTYGLQIVFVGVLLDQGGLPLPSFSLVIVAAGVATEAGQPVWPIFALAVLATLIADLPGSPVVAASERRCYG
jgi:membrane protein DedA with SNARE-associated domain